MCSIFSYSVCSLLRYSLEQPALPCTTRVDAAVMANARNILQRALPPNFQLEETMPIYTTGSNPHRWRATYRHTNNECANVRRAKSVFQQHCPGGCIIGTVEIQPIPNDERYCVEFIIRCQCNRRRRRNSHNNTKCCSGLIDRPEIIIVDLEELPCPISNATIIAEARRIIQNHTPPGFTLDTIAPSYKEGANFWSWSCLFIRNDGVYTTDCSFPHSKVRLPFRNYSPVSSDVAEKRFNMFEMENTSPFVQIVFLYTLGGELNEPIFNHTKIQALLKSNEKFDAVIVEQFLNDAMKGFAYHFGAVSIAFSTIGPNRWVNNLVANPENPSYIPDLFLSFSSQMTFYERFYNFVFGVTSDLLLYYYFYPSQNALLKKYFPNAPHLNDLQNNVSLVITNSHESLNAAVPHVPNMIDIGGYHVNPPKELPNDLKEFMDNSKEGVIYFSMGSNLVPTSMPKDKKDIILKVLGSRKEKVLWKWNEEQLPNKPSNFMISKWFPQQAILAHPNCKLFISHGGLLSLTETVYLGVPVLAFPIFGDQKLNAARVKSRGFGKYLPFSEITEEALVEALDELLRNPSYRENAQLSSKIMHDRPIKPIEVADYWIKYVVRHKGAPHLRVAGTNLPLYKYYMLDVFGVIVAAVLGSAFVLCKLCRLCCKRNRCGGEKAKSKSKKPKRE